MLTLADVSEDLKATIQGAASLADQRLTHLLKPPHEGSGRETEEGMATALKVEASPPPPSPLLFGLPLASCSLISVGLLRTPPFRASLAPSLRLTLRLYSPSSFLPPSSSLLS